MMHLDLICYWIIATAATYDVLYAIWWASYTRKSSLLFKCVHTLFLGIAIRTWVEVYTVNLRYAGKTDEMMDFIQSSWVWDARLVVSAVITVLIPAILTVRTVGDLYAQRKLNKMSDLQRQEGD